MLTRLRRESMPPLLSQPVKPTIAIVGASTRAAAASAARAGFQPITADLFADVDLREIATTTRISPYPDGLLDWLRTIDPPAWMYTGALENHPELVDQMAWIAPLWGNPGDVLQRVRSPWELQSALHDAGLLFPETRTNADGLPTDGSWLAKTYRGASGSGVRELLSPLLFREGLGEGSPVVFQQRIFGKPAAAVFIGAEDGASLLGVTQQLVGTDWARSHGFRYAGSIGPLPLEDAARSTIEQVGNVLADRFELVGLFGVDMILNDEGVWTIEVNPRFTASVEIVERIVEVRAIELHVAACLGSPVRALQLANAAPISSYGKVVLYAKRDVVLSPKFVESALAQAFQSPWPALADISPADDTIEAGRPILTLFAEGTDIAAVEQQLRRRVVELEQQIYVEGEA